MLYYLNHNVILFTQATEYNIIVMHGEHCKDCNMVTQCHYKHAWSTYADICAQLCHIVLSRNCHVISY